MRLMVWSEADVGLEEGGFGRKVGGILSCSDLQNQNMPRCLVPPALLQLAFRACGFGLGTSAEPSEGLL